MTKSAMAALAAVSALALGAVGTAHAATLDFSYTGLDAYGDDGSFNFSMDSMPTPFSYDDNYSTTFKVDGSFDNQAQTFYVTFNSSAFSGAFDAFYFDTAGDIEEFTGEGLAVAGGFQTFYAGSTASPVFSPGSYDAYYTVPIANSDQLNQVKVGELTISDAAVSAAPEPATWSLLFVGIGLAGLTLRSLKSGFRKATAI